MGLKTFQLNAKKNHFWGSVIDKVQGVDKTRQDMRLGGWSMPVGNPNLRLKSVQKMHRL
jgi:hypothetical protein